VRSIGRATVMLLGDAKDSIVGLTAAANAR
jgi:hypothetical protein